MKHYEIVIIGAGPGGYVSAIRAAQLGAKVAIVEKDKVGGACLNVGCIPTKALMKNVEILHYIQQGKKCGIQTGEIILDLKKAVKNKDKAVRQLVSGVEGLLASNGVDVYRGQGIVGDGKTVTVKYHDMPEEKDVITFDKLIIATGSRAAMPPIEGIELDGVVTSTELLETTEVPKHLIIIGGGVIGCELAMIFKAYGSAVTIVEMMPALGSGLDGEMSDYMHDLFVDMEVDILLEHQAEQITTQADRRLGLAVRDKHCNKKLLHGDKILISVGRKANMTGLEALDFELEKGFIHVNDIMETNIPDVYAIGDVTGKKLLAHVAEEMGIAAVENALCNYQKTIALDQIPGCIYTIPEMAAIGETEETAKAKGYDIVTGKFPLMACGKAVATGDTDGFFKIIADRKTDRILGAHLIGKSATELIAEIAAYMKMGACLSDIIETIHSHPTISEAVVEAARATGDEAIHMPRV